MGVIDEDKILQLISDFQKEHEDLLRKVKSLEKALNSASEERGDVSTRTEVALQETVAFLQGEFLDHCREEELLLYPLLRSYASVGPAIRDLVSEHAGLQEQADGFVKALGQIARHGVQIAHLVCEHIQHEDSVLLDLAKELRASEETSHARPGRADLGSERQKDQ